MTQDSPANNSLDATTLETVLTAHHRVLLIGASDQAISTALAGIQSLGFTGVGLYVRSNDGSSLVGTAHVGMGDDFIGSNISPRELTTADAAGPVGLIKSGFKTGRRPKTAEIERRILTPVFVSDSLLGAVVVDQTNGDAEPSSDALRLLPLLASQLGTIILTDRYKILEKKANNFQRVLQSYTEISSSLERAQTLKKICESAVALLGVDHSGLAIFDPELQSATVEAEYPSIGAQGLKIPLAGVEAEQQLITRQEVMIPDVETSETLGPVKDILKKLKVQSILIVTVVNKAGRPVGSFSLDSINKKREFTPDEIELCNMFAAKVAVALENSRLFEDTRNRVRQLETLRQTTLAITCPTEAGEVLDTITRHAVELLHGKTGGIYKYFPEAGELKVIADCNRPQTVGKVLKVGEGMAGKLVLSGADSMVIDNYNEWDGGAPIYQGERLFEAVLEVALKWRGETIGVLYVDDALGRKFNEGDAHLLRLFADHAAIALVHSDVAAENSAKSDRLELLLVVNSVVTHAENLGDGLQRLAQMVVSALRHSFCRILVLDENQTDLLVAAAYPIERDKGFQWTARLGERVPISEYPKLGTILDVGNPKICVWSERPNKKALRRMAERLGLKKISSLLLVPIKIGEELVGLLDVGEMRDTDRVTFNSDTADFLVSIASNVSVLIKRLRLHEAAARRRDLLTSLEEKTRYLRAEKETVKLQHEAVRLAVQLVSGSGGALFSYRPRQSELELATTYDLSLPEGLTIPDSDNVLGRVARTGKAEIFAAAEANDQPEERLGVTAVHKAFVIPVNKGTGEVRGVLLITLNPDQSPALEAEFEVLERFAAQISIALETSEFLGDDARVFRHLSILHQLSNYVQMADDIDRVLDAVLTGITAGYGLAFNRAAVLLRDRREPVLVGKRGIGHLELKKVEDSWRMDHRDGLYNFKVYLEHLDKGSLPMTPIGEGITRVRVPIHDDCSDLLSRTVVDRRPTRVPVDKLDQLPDSVRRLLNPTSEMIIAPMIVPDGVIGVLIVDNKFTGSPITEADEESLLTFTSTAAVAINNINLFRRIQSGQRKMRRFFQASSALSTSKDPRDVLEDIVAQTRAAANASWVCVVLSDELGRARVLITKGTDNIAKPDQLMRPDGIGAHVLKSEEAEIIEDTSLDRRVNPTFVPSRPQTLLCLPLVLQGKKFGVMWINYDQPRTFTELDIEAIKLYVNQAAIAYDSARRMDELNHMRRAAEALAKASDPQEVLRQIVNSAHSALQADSAAIWPYDGVRNSFVSENFVSCNIPNELVKEFGKSHPKAGGTAHTVMAKKWIVVEDISRPDYDFLGDSTKKLLASTGVQSFIGVSLTVGDEKLGVLYLNYNRTRQFNKEEQQLALTFANHAALALKKARLLIQVTKAKKAAEAVARVTVLGNRETTLESIVKEMQEALDCSAVMLFEYDKETQKLRHPPTMTGVTKPERARRLPEVDRDSIVYLMLERDEQYVVNDVSEDKLFHERRFAIEEEIQSCVAVPLKAMHQKVGVIFVNYRHHHRFTRDELDNINLFAAQAAVAIRNAQLFDDRNMQLRRQEALVKLSKELLSIPTLQETLDRAVRFAADELNTEFANIVLPDRNRDLIFSAAVGWPSDMVGTYKVPSGMDSQTGYTIESGDPVVVDDYIEEKRFNVVELVFEMGIRSGVSVPMVRDGKIIGAMLVHTRTDRHFSYEDVSLLTVVANATAIATKSAEQYEKSLRNTSYLRALHEASKAINSSFGEGSSTVLDEIVVQAVEGISGIEGPKAILGNIMIVDAKRDLLLLNSIYVKEEYKAGASVEGSGVSVDRLREGWPLEKERCANGRIGIGGRAAKLGRPQLVRDVHEDPDFVRINTFAKSALAVPLIDGERVLGVLNVESDQVGGFDNNDVTHLIALADLAVIAIRNTERFRELAETKGLVGARTALAWMGMATNAWRHAIEGDAVNIRNSVKLLKDLDLSAENISDRGRQKLSTRIEKIDHLAASILEKKITPPLSSEEGVEKVIINDLLRERIEQLWENEPYSRYSHSFEFSKTDALVTLSPEWFRRALDILVDNAIEAMAQSEERILTVRTIVPGSSPRQVWIEVADTGKGMDPDIANKVFKENIKLDDRSKGFGVGLLMVQAIVHTYNGEIQLKETSPHGTTFSISFPFAG